MLSNDEAQGQGVKDEVVEEAQERTGYVRRGPV
jgi:hypothetical protein